MYLKFSVEYERSIIILFDSFKWYIILYRYFLAIPSGRGAPHHRHLYAVKFTAVSSTATNSDSSNRVGHHHQQLHLKNIHHSTRNRPVCLSCDKRPPASRKHERRDLDGKQNRMDEARDDRLRQQQHERWEDEDEKIDQENTATSEGKGHYGIQIIMYLITDLAK